MFNRNKKQPEDMTDAEMQDRLGTLKGKIASINKWVPRVAAAMGGIGIAGLLCSIGVAAVTLPLTLTLSGGLVGLAALSLASGAAVRGSFESKIMWLSVENQDRIERVKLAQALADRKDEVKPVAQSTLDLRSEFNDAIEAMSQGTDRSVSVRRPLRFKSASFSMEY